MKTRRRALFSLTDKTGSDALAATLVENGYELISTGRTGAFLRQAGLPVTDISKVTGNPESFGGRVKTISFQIASALLFDRKRDLDEAEKLGIIPIDLVVCNLYKFGEARDRGADLSELAENIDIGGVTLIRAAAKNYNWVSVVVDPADYACIQKEITGNDGSIFLETRLKLMRKAFSYTAQYDAMIASAMNGYEASLETDLTDISERGFSGEKLRYGENPHQQAWISDIGGDGNFSFEMLQGKQLSYNNHLDLHASVNAVSDLQRSGCAVVKHTNICGYAESDDQKTSFIKAWNGDRISAFGSIIAFNSPLAFETIRMLNLDSKDKSTRKFVEIIAAPDFDPGVLEYAAKSAQMRVVRYVRPAGHARYDCRIVGKYLLKQEKDLAEPEIPLVKTSRDFKPEIFETVQFGIRSVTHLKSNAISIVRRNADGSFQLIGMGAGQPNRVVSVRLAIAKARENFVADSPEIDVKMEFGKCLLVSDAFFPFPDAVEECAEAGICHILQPGGSIRDPAVIEACNRLNLAMAFTGRRHFKH